MPTHQESRRARSARHYLINGPMMGRLGTTLALVSRSMGFPVVRVNIVDEDSQHSISLFGADHGDAISRSEAFCDVVVRNGRPMRVEDAAVDSRFNSFPAVIGGEIGAYLGVALKGRESLIVGAVCVIDPHPRTLGAEHQARLVEFGRIVEDPRQFVPLAEDSNLIIELDLAVMRALADLSRWQRTNPLLRMAVNLSARHFEQHDCAAKLLAAASAARVPPGSVDLELTETLRAVKGYADIAGVVQQLRELGFGVLLDDFGTGWSSLDHLLWLRVDGIKIDRAVTVALGTPIGDALTRSVTGLAHALGLRTTIEGIETQLNADLARAHACNYGQGYLWAPPEPAASIDNSPHARPGPPAMAGTSRSALVGSATRNGTSTTPVATTR